MSSTALEEELTDRVFRYSGEEKGTKLSGRIVYRGDGVIVIRTVQGDLDAGTWRTEGSNFCTRITRFRKGARKCFTVIAQPNGEYTTSHGFLLTPVGG